jgi:hypothetical protein
MAIYSGFFPLKMVIFHSYVKLPEGMGDMGFPHIPAMIRITSDINV